MAGGGERMKIKNVVLNLSPEETLRLTRILMDEDEKEALSFLKECSNLNWTRQSGTIECRSLRLRISLLKKMCSVNIKKVAKLGRSKKCRTTQSYSN